MLHSSYEVHPSLCFLTTVTSLWPRLTVIVVCLIGAFPGPTFSHRVEESATQPHVNCDVANALELGFEIHVHKMDEHHSEDADLQASSAVPAPRSLSTIGLQKTGPNCSGVFGSAGTPRMVFSR